MNFERLPYWSRPGFDCISDHANCPMCLNGSAGNHGRSGGRATFAIASTMVDGRRAVLVLEVLLGHWLPCSPHVTPELRRARGSMVGLHIEGDAESCDWIGEGLRCDNIPRHSVTVASQLYKEHGNEAGDENQSPAFWGALEALFRTWIDDELVIH